MGYLQDGHIIPVSVFLNYVNEAGPKFIEREVTTTRQAFFATKMSVGCTVDPKDETSEDYITGLLRRNYDRYIAAHADSEQARIWTSPVEVWARLV